MLQNFTDGVFYLGYAMNFGELVDRVGLNYYAVRFGAIFPDAVAFSILGPVAGFSALRYFLSGIACVLLFLAFRRRFDSLWVGLFGAAAWAFNPAAIRLLQTGYVDVAGSLFLVIGVGLVFLDKGSWIFRILAGMSFGMAFWSHLHAGFALFFLCPLLGILKLESGWKELLKSAGGWLVGGALVTLGGVLFYGINYGLWDITSPTREYLRLLTEVGLAARWVSPWGQILATNTFWLIPVPLLLMLIFSGIRQKVAVFATLGVVGYIGFLFYGDLFKGGFSLSMFYYFSFVLASLVVLQTVLVASSIQRSQWVVIAFLLALVVPPLTIKFLSGGLFFPVWLPLTMLLVFGIGFFISRRDWRAASVAAMVALTSGLISGASSSRLALGNYWKKDDIGLLAIGQRLTESLPRYQADSSPIVFWYKNEDGTGAKMIQSLFLHNFTLFQNSPEDFVPFVPLEAEAVATLKNRGIKHIVILDSNEAVLDEAVGYLKDGGLEFDKLRFFSISEKKEKIQVVHVVLKNQQFSKKENIEISHMDLQKRSFSAELVDGVQITTAPVKWNFDAFLSIPKPAKNCGLRLKFRVPNGRVFVGLFRNQEPDGELATREFAANAGSIETVFPPEACEEARFIGIRNASPNGVRSEIIIQEVELVHFE